MATTFSAAKNGLDDIARRITSHRSQLSQTVALAQGAASGLGAMTAEYAGLIADINAAAAASPGNVALQAMKAEAALLSAEFSTLLSTAQQVEAAVQGITI